MKYVKLTMANDWGRDFYRKPRFANEPQADSAEQAIRWKHGELVSVRFPDGHETMGKLVSNSHSQVIHDMGRASEVTSDVPVLTVDYHGVRARIDLGMVEVLQEWADRD